MSKRDLTWDETTDSWRDLEPTLPQLRMLDGWGIKAEGLTRGEVSDLITDELARRKSESLDYDREEYDDQS